MFTPSNFEEAQHNVVGECNGIPTKIRWEHETPIMVEIITNEIKKRGAKKILDYGCGTGRIAKGLIEANRDIELIGLDKSKHMLKEATNYVLSERFKPNLTYAVKPEKVDFAYCVYVFQHIHAIDLREAMAFIADSCDSLFVVNSVCRMAVTLDGKNFHEDKISVLDELGRFYSKISWGIPLQSIVENPIMRQMFLEGATLHWGAICEK